MLKLAAVLSAFAVLGTASFAQAGSLGQACTQAPKEQWLSMDALQKKVEEVGFKVQKSKLRNSCAEFYVTAQTGARMEVFSDPATGTIIAAQ